MEISKEVLNSLVIAFEISLPIVLVASCFLFPGKRKFILPALGSITPAIAVLCYMSVGYYAIDQDEYAFAFGAMWVMGFLAYCVLAVIGLVVALVLRNRTKPQWAFLVALITAPILVGGLVAIENVA